MQTQKCRPDGGISFSRKRAAPRSGAPPLNQAVGRIGSHALHIAVCDQRMSIGSGRLISRHGGAMSMLEGILPHLQESPMKRMIGAAIANWFRKPENREKAKRTAKQMAQKYQNQRKKPPNDSSSR
ncbi:hypothetical protein Csal_2322 [Chromohalobacter israelensis DSM 3043]|uniref:Uncharacterized protein n=1 Tax=Chromohalobacter israelensis (strain ATCC BAA-138 / DSM 3043 / CIP 106854 / NCIMB 13768 / 1H11) TaxID=290398 RepID=Q1QV36_CHRI1|nr:hypothetical protein Csal_2322 [Chromohalobacter salexigens DSM 3043]